MKLDLTGTYCKSKLFDNTWEPSVLVRGIISSICPNSSPTIPFDNIAKNYTIFNQI